MSAKLEKKNINCLAKRFAAKEAFSKALGTGISNGINFNERLKKMIFCQKTHFLPCQW